VPGWAFAASGGCRGRPRSLPPTRRPIFSGLSALPPTLWVWEGVWPDRFSDVAWGTCRGGRSRLWRAAGGAPGHFPRPEALFSKFWVNFPRLCGYGWEFVPIGFRMWRGERSRVPVRVLRGLPGRPRSLSPTRRPIFSGLSELPPTLWEWEGFWPDRFVDIAWGTGQGGRGLPPGAAGIRPRSLVPTRRPIFIGLGELTSTLWVLERVWPDRFVDLAWGTGQGGCSRLPGAPGQASITCPDPRTYFHFQRFG
jgi:hypothetical protein